MFQVKINLVSGSFQTQNSWLCMYGALTFIESNSPRSLRLWYNRFLNSSADRYSCRSRSMSSNGQGMKMERTAVYIWLKSTPLHKIPVTHVAWAHQHELTVVWYKKKEFFALDFHNFWNIPLCLHRINSRWYMMKDSKEFRWKQSLYRTSISHTLINSSEYPERNVYFMQIWTAWQKHDKFRTKRY